MSDTLSGETLTDATVSEAKLATAVSNKISNAYTQANNAYSKANAALTSEGTLSGNLTITTNLVVGGSLIVGESIEQINVTSTAMGANVNFDILTQPILYLNTSATANSTVNFRGNSTVTLENFLSTGNCVTTTMLVTNGLTPYRVSNVQIDGVEFTPKWAGGLAPTNGNSSAIDLYSFTIIKTSSLNYTVLASLQKYA